MLGSAAMRATSAMISATPALSSTASSVLPSLVRSSLPTNWGSAGVFSGVSETGSPLTVPSTSSPPS